MENYSMGKELERASVSILLTLTLLRPCLPEGV